MATDDSLKHCFACGFSAAGITCRLNRRAQKSPGCGKNLGKKLERHRRAEPLTSTRYLVLGLVLGLSAVTAACGNAATSVISTTVPDAPSTVRIQSTEAVTTEPAALEPVVRVGLLEFPVEVAADSGKQNKGLSGRESLDAGTGMLFVFESAERFRFWMREMEISLDMVWIGPNCRVVDVSENVPFPEPDTPLHDLPRYSPESPAKYVLEINGGESADLGLKIGDQVEFVGLLAGKYGC